MSREHFMDLTQQAKNLGATSIALLGYGEPLMDGGLIRKIRYVTNMGMDSFITTNASLLTEEKTELLLGAGLKKIRFSVHGVEKNYEKVHRNLKWETVFDNIIDFLVINEIDFNHQCTVAMSVIPMHQECPYYFRYLWENKVDELEVWRPHNWTEGRSFRHTQRMKKTCGRPFSGPVQIQADGKMIVCCFDFNGLMEVGDTHKNTIEEILKGSAFNMVRAKHEIGNLEGLPCETCDQLNIEEESPLLYSNVDPECEVGKTSSIKFKLEN
jgi:sulfatase maturation enzyme AslB (radical SAM superfamily)